MIYFISTDIACHEIIFYVVGVKFTQIRGSANEAKFQPTVKSQIEM